MQLRAGRDSGELNQKILKEEGRERGQRQRVGCDVPDGDT